MSRVRLIVQCTADSAEIADEAITEAVERCKRVQQEPGCLQFEVFRSALRSEHYVLLEQVPCKGSVVGQTCRHASHAGSGDDDLARTGRSRPCTDSGPRTLGADAALEGHLERSVRARLLGDVGIVNWPGK